MPGVSDKGLEFANWLTLKEFLKGKAMCSGGCGRLVEQSTVGQQVWCESCSEPYPICDSQTSTTKPQTLFGFPVVVSPDLAPGGEIVLGDFTERIPITVRKQPDSGNEEGQPLFIATPEKQ